MMLYDVADSDTGSDELLVPSLTAALCRLLPSVLFPSWVTQATAAALVVPHCEMAMG